MRLIVDENTVIGAHGRTNIHATDAVGTEGDPVAAAWQHFASQAWTFEAAAFHHDGQTCAEGSRDHLAEFQINAEIAQMLDRQRVDQSAIEQRCLLAGESFRVRHVRGHHAASAALTWAWSKNVSFRVTRPLESTST